MKLQRLTLIPLLVLAPGAALATGEMNPEEAAKQVVEGQMDPESAAASEPEMQQEAAPETTDTAKDTAEASVGSVARSAFTTDVVDREPVDRVDVLSDRAAIYFFTELHDMAGQTVLHRWEHDGQVMAEVPFEVKGPRWRVYSKKTLLPDWKGDWTVTVVDASGDPVETASFSYSPQEHQAPSPIPASPLEDETATGAETDAEPSTPASPAEPK